MKQQLPHAVIIQILCVKSSATKHKNDYSDALEDMAKEGCGGDLSEKQLSSML